MNLGNVHSDSAPRRAWMRRVAAPRQVSAMTLAVVVGVFGLVGVRPAEGRADAAAAVGDAAPVVELPVPPRVGGFTSLPQGTPEPDPSATTTTAPAQST